MSFQRRFMAGDEELGKKDDDHQHRVVQPAAASEKLATFTWRGPRRKRTLLALTVFLLLYLFFKNIPSDSFVANRRAASKKQFSGAGRYATSSPKGPPRAGSSTNTKHYYEGPIEYYNLGASFGTALGLLRDKRNVLFVVSSLKSTASLLPLACDMSQQNRSQVHILLVGRDEIAIEDIKRINGVSDADCAVRWHDGRPDYSPYSTDDRMGLSVRATLTHIATAIRPSAVLIDSLQREDAFLFKETRAKTKSLGLTLIELPENAAEHLRWISKLDDSSLKSWNGVNIELLIHAPPESSGSLIRLLKSLADADYFGFPLPRLTIELPSKIDPPTSRYLSTFRWPPGSGAGSSKLHLRHRIASVRVDAAQAAIRQIESFYPSDIPNSNFLVLSPQVELSPLYFQYLVYTLLEYKYSRSALHTSANLLGISLEKPLTALDGRGNLSPPENPSSSSLFLFQAPNSNAALYFGDKWVEIHSFLSNRFAAGSANAINDDVAYLIAKTYPSWLAYMLELCRARGYTMLYPNLLSLDDSLATIHTEMYQLPEEYSQEASASASNSISSPSTSSKPVANNDNNDNHNSLTGPSTPQLLSLSPYPSATNEKQQSPSLLSTSRSLLHLFSPTTLPPTDPGVPLPDLLTLPLLSHTGQHLPGGQASLDEVAMAYSVVFAQQIGGCHDEVEGDTDSSGAGVGNIRGNEEAVNDNDTPETMKKDGDKKEKSRPRRPRVQWSADDLFCTPPVL